MPYVYIHTLGVAHVHTQFLPLATTNSVAVTGQVIRIVHVPLFKLKKNEKPTWQISDIAVWSAMLPMLMFGGEQLASYTYSVI